MKLCRSAAGDCTEERTQGVMNHIVHFGKAKTEAVLAVLDADAQQRENAGHQHNFPDLSPPLWQHLTAQKAGEVEEYCIHEIRAVEFLVTAVEGGVVGGEGH